MFSLSMVWAQIFPFVALQLFESDDDDFKVVITMFLVGSFSLWVVLNVVFFCTVDTSYLNTFFGTKTVSEYVGERAKRSSSFAQRAVIIRISNSLHHQQQVNVRVVFDEQRG